MNTNFGKFAKKTAPEVATADAAKKRLQSPPKAPVAIARNGHEGKTTVIRKIMAMRSRYNEKLNAIMSAFEEEILDIIFQEGGDAFVSAAPVPRFSTVNLSNLMDVDDDDDEYDDADDACDNEGDDDDNEQGADDSDDDFEGTKVENVDMRDAMRFVENLLELAKMQRFDGKEVVTFEDQKNALTAGYSTFVHSKLTVDDAAPVADKMRAVLSSLSSRATSIIPHKCNFDNGKYKKEHLLLMRRVVAVVLLLGVFDHTKIAEVPKNSRLDCMCKYIAKIASKPSSKQLVINTLAPFLKTENLAIKHGEKMRQILTVLTLLHVSYECHIKGIRTHKQEGSSKGKKKAENTKAEDKADAKDGEKPEDNEAADDAADEDVDETDEKAETEKKAKKQKISQESE